MPHVISKATLGVVNYRRYNMYIRAEIDSVAYYDLRNNSETSVKRVLVFFLALNATFL